MKTRSGTFIILVALAACASPAEDAGSLTILEGLDMDSAHSNDAGQPVDVFVSEDASSPVTGDADAQDAEAPDAQQDAGPDSPLSTPAVSGDMIWAIDFGP
jgi:hypothetical protein